VKSGLGEQAASTLQRRLSNLDATNHTKVPVVSFMNGVRGALLHRNMASSVGSL
jgi:hypothetical protein